MRRAEAAPESFFIISHYLENVMCFSIFFYFHILHGARPFSGERGKDCRPDFNTAAAPDATENIREASAEHFFQFY